MSGQAARAEKRRQRRVELRVGATASHTSEMQECFGFDLERLLEDHSLTFHWQVPPPGPPKKK